MIVAGSHLLRDLLCPTQVTPVRKAEVVSVRERYRRSSLAWFEGIHS